jgi:hypothetical protein
MKSEKWIKIRYEDFVSMPEKSIEEIGKFMKFQVSVEEYRNAVKNVRQSSVGKNKLDSPLSEESLKIMQNTLVCNGYSS